MVQHDCCEHLVVSWEAVMLCHSGWLMLQGFLFAWLVWGLFVFTDEVVLAIGLEVKQSEWRLVRMECFLYREGGQTC